MYLSFSIYVLRGRSKGLDLRVLHDGAPSEVKRMKELKPVMPSQSSWGKKEPEVGKEVAPQKACKGTTGGQLPGAAPRWPADR